MSFSERQEAYMRFLGALGVELFDAEPAHALAFNIAWHAGIRATEGERR